jgi:hypothetical protein
MRRIAHSFSVLFLLPLLAGGCAENEQSSPPKLSAPDPTDQVYGLILPFDSFQLSLEEIYQDSAARDELIRRCLKKEGYGWPALDYPSSAPDPKNRRRYGVIEEAVAKRLGYHPAPGMLGSIDVVKQREERDKSLSAEVFNAVYDEKSGCAKKSSDYLVRNGGRADYDLFNRLSAETFDKARSEPEVRRATYAWRSCMAEQGLKYTAPSDAADDQRWWSKDTEHPSSAEIATAVADVGCQRKSKVIISWYNAEKRLQREAVKEHRGYFDSLRRAKNINIANARHVLAGG